MPFAGDKLMTKKRTEPNLKNWRVIIAKKEEGERKLWGISSPRYPRYLVCINGSLDHSFFFRWFEYEEERKGQAHQTPYFYNTRDHDHPSFSYGESWWWWYWCGAWSTLCSIGAILLCKFQLGTGDGNDDDVWEEQQYHFYYDWWCVSYVGSIAVHAKSNPRVEIGLSERVQVRSSASNKNCPAIFFLSSRLEGTANITQSPPRRWRIIISIYD